MAIDYLVSIRHLGNGSQTNYKQRLTVFADWCSFQGITLEQVNHRQVQAFIEWLTASHKPHKSGQATLSSATTTGYVRVILSFLHWCLADEEYSQYVKLQTVKNIKLGRMDQLVKEVFTNEEIEALFAAAQKNPMHQYKLRDMAVLAMLLDTGIRAEELCTLTIGNTFLARTVSEDSYIKVMGKGRKEREIPLGDKARRALNRYLREYRKDTKKGDPVFLSRYHTRLTGHALALILDRLKDVSTLPKDAQINPHKFRHSFAARYMSNGGDVYDLARLMGHSSVAITEGYLKSLSAKAVRTRKKHLSVLDSL